MNRLAVVAALALGLGGSAQSGGEILFWTTSPIPSLRAMRPDGTHVRRIAGRQNAKRPSLSPDRRWVAFDGTPEGKPPLSDFDVQVVRVEGTQRRTVVATADWELDAKWSRDGKRLSFSRMPPGADWRHSIVCTVRLDGSGLQKLGPGTDARWSPDGTRLVVAAPGAASEGDLFVVDADGSGRELLLANGQLKRPAGWSPDGKRILFTQFHDAGAGTYANGDVYLMNADGTGVRRLTADPADDAAADWSPDGRQILFTRNRTGRSQIYAMRLDRTHLRNLSGKRTDEFDPSWR
jgi:Tol biopolymer transport system component